jgi:hypothetical protein
MKLTLPDAMRSLEESLQVTNDDLAGLSPSELAYEMLRAARLAARDPERLLLPPGGEHITVRRWADERISRIRELQVAPRRPLQSRRVGRTWV